MIASLCKRFNTTPSVILAEPAELTLEVSSMLAYAEARELVDAAGEKSPAPKWAEDMVMDIEVERYRRRQAAEGAE